jgi:putative ABC transport system permease protein
MVVTALTRKLLRDLLLMKGQVITIALVVACGVASYVAAAGTFRSLSAARDVYYERYRFGDVFASAERAPDALARRVEEIPGVRTVHTRIVKRVSIPVEGLPEPAVGILTSLPATGEAPLNALHLRAGRLPDPARSDEIVVGEAFAKAHGLAPGAELPMIINGAMRTMRVAGIGMSPEYVFVISEAVMMPDDRRSGVFWVSQQALASAFRMEGAFNDVVVRLQRGASAPAVIAEIDRLLEPYGGRGAVARDEQTSNRAVDGELAQLQGFGVAIPAIFLGVAAFLLNIVLSRLVELQRTQIAILKALGYSGFAIARHYLELIGVVVVFGALLGLPVGVWVGQEWTGMYGPFFRFPDLRFSLEPGVAAAGVFVSVAAAVLAALRTVRRVAKLPPAEAMNPPAPPRYGTTFLQRMGALRWATNAGRMVLREVLRRPLRTLLSSSGIAAAMAIVVLGSFQFDAVESFMDLLFSAGMREDMSLTLLHPIPESAVANFESLPGVRRAEGARAVPVRFHVASRARDGIMTGHPEGETLRRMVEWPATVARVQGEELAISRKLGEVLGVREGDALDVEVLEREHRRRAFVVTRLLDDFGGLNAHLELGAMARFLGETPSVSAVYLRVDPTEEATLQARVKQMPGVLGVGRRGEVIAAYRKQMAETQYLFTTIITVFAVVIAVGIVYNNARVVLSTRSRELASLRVLGFTRGEVSTILLGELALQVLLAVPIGIPLGRAFAELMMSTVDPEQFRFHLVIGARTYAFAVIVVLAAALVSALLVRRRLDRLDLVGVLKTKE